MAPHVIHAAMDWLQTHRPTTTSLKIIGGFAGGVACTGIAIAGWSVPWSDMMSLSQSQTHSVQTATNETTPQKSEATPQTPTSNVAHAPAENSSTSARATASTTKDPCQYQTWPYLNQRCQNTADASETSGRRIRVISTDGNAPSSITTGPAASAPVAAPASQAKSVANAETSVPQSANVGAPAPVEQTSTEPTDSTVVAAQPDDANPNAVPLPPARPQVATADARHDVKPKLPEPDSSQPQSQAQATLASTDQTPAAKPERPRAKKSARRAEKQVAPLSRPDLSDGIQLASHPMPHEARSLRGNDDRDFRDNDDLDRSPARGRNVTVQQTYELADGRRVTVTRTFSGDASRDSLRDPYFRMDRFRTVHRRASLPEETFDDD